VLVIAPKFTSFFLEVMNGIERAAAEKGYTAYLGAANARSPDVAMLFDQVAQSRVDGAIVLNGYLPPAIHDNSNVLSKIIVALEPVDSHSLPTVSIDHESAAAQATQYLLRLGHRAIAHIAGPSHVLSARARAQGFARAMAGAGVRDPVIVEGDFSIESGMAVMRSILSRPKRPTAVVASNDDMAIGAVQAIRSLGLSVPQDISVIGFDDQDILKVFDPPLTTMRVPCEDMGYWAMTQLVDMLENNIKPQGLVLPSKLVARASTVPPARKKP
jgi:LacI family repressor for deo operon, udp, cdd, tsx, nupC, and nupG